MATAELLGLRWDRVGRGLAVLTRPGLLTIAAAWGEVDRSKVDRGEQVVEVADVVRDRRPGQWR
ncbi:MAG TPA: hypothetical protein VFE55_01600 [Acidimicrobiia bacterium]|nr:hypothetical protein [Acidimicrobiia bacterium]